MNTTFERRTFLGDVEFRAAGDGGKSIMAVGYAAKFGVLSQNLGGYVEDVAPGCFARTIRESDIRALFNHDQNLLLGRNKSGTLRLSEDAVGLAYEIDLPDTSVGRDVAVMLERGDCSGSSFGFRVVEDTWGESETGFPLRTLVAVQLRDISPVVYPAYTDSEAALRSLSEARSLDLATLVEAANKNALQDALTGSGDNSEEERTESDDWAKPVIAPHKFVHLAG